MERKRGVKWKEKVGSRKEGYLGKDCFGKRITTVANGGFGSQL